MSTDLVTTNNTVRFGGGRRRAIGSPDPQVRYTPPRNTLDARYENCTDHRVACDCREAEFAEDRQESRGYITQVEQAFSMVLAGHPTRTSGDARPCQCSGCQIARIAHIYPKDGFQ